MNDGISLRLKKVDANLAEFTPKEVEDKMQTGEWT